MKEKKNEKWLDELIYQAINTTKPEFDSEKWKQKYPDEFQMLKSRGRQSASVIKPSIWRSLLQNRLTKLAAAALIILAIGFFVIHLVPGEKVDTAEVPKVTKSPAELLTVASLNMAYRRGGVEAVERQCEQAIDKLGPRPAKITVNELLAEFNGT